MLWHTLTSGSVSIRKKMEIKELLVLTGNRCQRQVDGKQKIYLEWSCTNCHFANEYIIAMLQISAYSMHAHANTNYI